MEDIIYTLREAWKAAECRLLHRYLHNSWKQYVNSTLFKCLTCGRHWRW